MPGMLWARFLGSPRPPRADPLRGCQPCQGDAGRRAVLTGRDAEGILLGRRLQDQPVICWDTVRFVGDRVAAVAADTPEQAAAALDEIEVEFEDLPASHRCPVGIGARAPVLHPAASTYRYIGGERPPVDHPNLGERDSTGPGRAGHRGGLRIGSPRVRGSVHDAPPAPRCRRTARHACLDRSRRDGAHRLDQQGSVRIADPDGVDIRFDPTRIVIESSLIGGDFGGKGYSPDDTRATCWPGPPDVRSRPSRCTRRSRRRQYPSRGGNPPPDGGRCGWKFARSRGRGAVRRRCVRRREGRQSHDAGRGSDPGRLPHPECSPRRAHRLLEHGASGQRPGTGRIPDVVRGAIALDSIARALGRDPLEFRLQNAVRPGEVGALGNRFHHVRAKRPCRPWSGPLTGIAHDRRATDSGWQWARGTSVAAS